jgi:acetyltransferase-like isoleucine patch superfamily enzyme
VARVAADPVRVACHRRRGVALGEGVSLGYDTVIETAFPNLVKIGNGVNVGMRVTIIAHFRGMEGSDTGPPTVVIEDDAFIGPGAIILPNVTIGRAAVVAAGSVVSSSVPPLTFVHGNPAKPVARCGVPLTGETTYEEFLRSLIPLGPQEGSSLPGLNRRPSSAGAGSSTDRVSRGAIATTDDN